MTHLLLSTMTHIISGDAPAAATPTATTTLPPPPANLATVTSIATATANTATGLGLPPSPPKETSASGNGSGIPNTTIGLVGGLLGLAALVAFAVVWWVISKMRQQKKKEREANAQKMQQQQLLQLQQLHLQQQQQQQQQQSPSSTVPSHHFNSVSGGHTPQAYGSPAPQPQQQSFPSQYSDRSAGRQCSGQYSDGGSDRQLQQGPYASSASPLPQFSSAPSQLQQGRQYDDRRFPTPPSDYGGFQRQAVVGGGLRQFQRPQKQPDSGRHLSPYRPQDAPSEVEMRRAAAVAHWPLPDPYADSTVYSGGPASLMSDDHAGASTVDLSPSPGIVTRRHNEPSASDRRRQRQQQKGSPMPGPQPARWTQAEELLASMMDLNLDQSDGKEPEDGGWETEDGGLDAAVDEDEINRGEWYSGGAVGDGGGGEDSDGEQEAVGAHR